MVMTCPDGYVPAVDLTGTPSCQPLAGPPYGCPGCPQYTQPGIGAAATQVPLNWPVGACRPGLYLTYDAMGVPVCLPQPPETVQDTGCPGCAWPAAGVGSGGTGGGGAKVAIAAALLAGSVAVAAAYSGPGHHTAQPRRHGGPVGPVGPTWEVTRRERGRQVRTQVHAADELAAYAEARRQLRGRRGEIVKIVRAGHPHAA